MFATDLDALVCFRLLVLASAARVRHFQTKRRAQPRQRPCPCSLLVVWSRAFCCASSRGRIVQCEASTEEILQKQSEKQHIEKAHTSSGLQSALNNKLVIRGKIAVELRLKQPTQQSQVNTHAHTHT